LFKEERKRIADEINLLKSLKHPNVIHFINAWINRQKDEVVFITEIVTGGSLKKYIRSIFFGLVFALLVISKRSKVPG
jgi:WNK lysine deficient protein kinase